MEAVATTTATRSNGTISGGTEHIVSAIHFAESNNNGGTVISIYASNEDDFELMDSLYHAAANGDTSKFINEDRDSIKGLVTPTGNTILHIYITARPQTAERSKVNSFSDRLFLKKRSGDAINRNNNFLKYILNICRDLLWKANKKGETLLHMAARHGHADIVEILVAECRKPCQNDVEKGIEAIRLMLGSTNEGKDTALHEAVRYNHVDAVKILNRSAPYLSYEVNKAGETPLYLAAERRYRDIVKDILDTFETPAYLGPCNRTALHAAVLLGDFEMTNMLLAKKEFGFLTSKADVHGMLPLHYAAFKGYAGIAKVLLIQDKSAAYKQSSSGVAPIHFAASKGWVDVMQEFELKCPGCFELVDSRGLNVLHHAVLHKKKKAVEFLLQNPVLGNLINERDNEGNTPLLCHAASGSYMGYFIRHSKVDKQVFNSHNLSATDIVSDNFIHISVMCTEARWLRRHDLAPTHLRRVEAHRSKSGEGNDEEGDNNMSRDSTDNQTEINDAREAHLIVATLIATVTFAAGLTVPGGYINDKGPDQGSAILTGSAAFKAFVIFNTIAMIISSSVVFLHLLLALTRNKMRFMFLLVYSLLLTAFAMLAMVLAFITGTYSILNHSPGLAISACVIGCIYFFVYTMLPLDLYLTSMLRTCVAALKKLTHCL